MPETSPTASDIQMRLKLPWACMQLDHQHVQHTVSVDDRYCLKHLAISLLKVWRTVRNRIEDRRLWGQEGIGFIHSCLMPVVKCWGVSKAMVERLWVSWTHASALQHCSRPSYHEFSLKKSENFHLFVWVTKNMDYGVSWRYGLWTGFLCIPGQ